MNWPDIIVVVLILSAVIAAIFAIRKGAGKCGGCRECPYRNHCEKKNN